MRKAATRQEGPTKMPKFKVGDEVIELNGIRAKVVAIEWCFAYKLEGRGVSLFDYQEDEIRRA